MATLLKVENISKSYGPNPALKSVSLELNAGEVHGLVGENGSGKSTLLNIICGHPILRETGGYAGNLWLEGKAVQIPSPRAAIELGIGMVHQEFTLLPGLTVAENILFGRESLLNAVGRVFPAVLSLIDKKAGRERAAEALGRLGIEVDPSLYPFTLPVNLQQFVEIARETSRTDLRILVLDEPTATLGKEDAATLLESVKVLALTGIAVLFVSHRLEEVVRVCDRVTVLRDGEVVARLERGMAELKIETIVRAMLGRIVPAASDKKPAMGGKVALEFRDWKVAMPGEGITGLNLKVRQGEVVGITGLAGHGKMALGYGLVGMFPTSGLVSAEGRTLNTASPRSAIANGVHLLPDDRRSAGLLLERSITENIIFSGVQHKGAFLKFTWGRFSPIDWKRAEEYTRECVRKYDIRCSSINQPVGLLSGGNQQKVCLARVMGLGVRVLVVSEPTRGIDIGARQVILKLLREASRNSGTGIICVSSDLGDLKQVCDRIAVMCNGAIQCELPPTASEAEFAAAFSGERLSE